jgi:GntR family phosphonate transport system transcriptional regulator
MKEVGMLIRGNGAVLWRQVYDGIEKDIASGFYTPGDRLPSENRLAKELSVNRHTVRRAMAALDADGLVRIERGRGSFVREPIIHYPVSKRTRFSENLSSQKRTPNNVLILAVEVEADSLVAAALKITPGEIVTQITSAGEADGRRISYAHSYFPQTMFPGMSAIYGQLRSVTLTLKHFGVDDYQREKTRIISRMPTANEAKELGQPKTRPVLITESINVDNSGTPVEFGISLFASDWVQLLIEPTD